MKKICQQCGKAEDANKHIRYGNDLDNPVKHQFVPATKPPTKGSLWWVARASAGGNNDYLLSRNRLIKPLKSEREYVIFVVQTIKQKVYAFYPCDWDKLFGLRLNPGDGPVRIRIKPGWWERV